MNDSLSKTWLQYEAGKDYKRRIGLYKTVRENERFYRGDQWYMIPSSNLPRPVFNVVKRIVDHLCCTVVPSRISIRYFDENLPFVKDASEITALTKVLTDNARYRWERAKMDSKLYSLVTDAAVTGDGVLYCYWKHDLSGDGKYFGDIQTDIIDNVNLFVADVNKSDIQSQDFIILSGRASVSSLRREARENGVTEGRAMKIVADKLEGVDFASDFASAELDGEDEEKATYLIKFWKEDGFVYFEKSTRNCVINRAKTPCTLYPVAYFNWQKAKNSFHGTSIVSSMIANQKYINRAYAMVMKHMSDTAFSKVIYDKTKIPEWSNEVGEAIASIGATNVSDAVSVLPVGKLQDNYLDLLKNVISNTKELSGATETALGNVNPQNTSAILAIQEASRIPLKLVRSALYQCIEDLANIWADMVFAYYSEQRFVPMLDMSGGYTSCRLPEHSDQNTIRAFVEVVDMSTYSSALTVSILDKLLEGGHITLEQYISRIPSEYIDNPEGLIGGAANERASSK
ncbi:MAG: hypothetical protein IKA84_04435 [Clostridia bacterium]|nr:hypothetical protein [Clostridia bacterium]